jgi:hypothetical protein
MCNLVVSSLFDGGNTVDLQSITLIERFCKFWVFGFSIVKILCILTLSRSDKSSKNRLKIMPLSKLLMQKFLS